MVLTGVLSNPRAALEPLRGSNAQALEGIVDDRASPDCDQPYVAQELLEGDLLATLRVVALPEGLAEEVDEAIAEVLTEEPAQSRQSTLATIDSHLGRLAELYEPNDISREEYQARREELQNKRKTIETSRPQPVFAR